MSLGDLRRNRWAADKHMQRVVFPWLALPPRLGASSSLPPGKLLSGRESQCAVPRRKVTTLLPLLTLTSLLPHRFGDRSNLTDRGCSGACLPGHFCPEGSSSGEAHPCPGGRFGSAAGLKDPLCSGPCREGYLCPPGSASPTRDPCGAPSLFCPWGSAVPTPASQGFHTVGVDPLHRTGQLSCEPGYYCSMGERLPCPSGSFGVLAGLADPGVAPFLCSGPCPPGHYCPEASSLPLPCPAGTFASVSGMALCEACPVGHFCALGAVRPSPCAAGLFGNCTGARDASCRGGVDCYASDWARSMSSEEFAARGLGSCSAGYFCPEGSTDPQQRECGDARTYYYSVG